MWGVQSAAVECPAHTALLQSIWNHPAGEKGQKLQFERPPRTPNLPLQFGPIFSLGMYLLRERGGGIKRLYYFVVRVVLHICFQTPHNPPRPPQTPPMVWEGQKWPKCTYTSPVLIINEKKNFQRGENFDLFFHSECTSCNVFIYPPIGFLSLNINTGLVEVHLGHFWPSRTIGGV